MIYVAKAINCATGRTVLFDSGEVSLVSGGWSMSANYSSPENLVPGILDDTYCYKENNNLTLNFGITCAASDQARNKTEEILAVFSSKAQIYLFDDRYIYVYPKGNAGKFPDSDTRYVDLTLNLTANPYFEREVVKEYMVTPRDYPGRVEMESPDPRLNVQFGNYNTVNGVKVTDNNGWSTSTSVAGYSGSGYAVTPMIGDGVTFTCIGGFSVRLYMVIGRKVRVFEGSTVLLEKTFTNGSAAWGNLDYVFSDTKVHTVTVVHVEGAGFAVDYIDLIPSSVQTLSNEGTADSYPVIELAPVETTIRYSPLGKITGDTTHPCAVKALTFTNISNVNVSMGSEWTQYAYDLMSFCGTPSASAWITSSNTFQGVLSVFDFKSSKSGIPSTWSVSDILSSLRKITSRQWAFGTGVDSSITHYKNACEMLSDFSTSSGYYAPKSSAIESVNPKQGTGFYRMTINDNSSVPLSTRRGVVFPNLPAGKYFVSAFVNGNKRATLYARHVAAEVTNKAFNDYGAWSRVGLKLNASSVSNIEVGLEMETSYPYVIGDYSYIDAISVIPISDDDYNNVSISNLLNKYSYGGEIKNGVEVYMWRKSTSSWESKVEKSTSSPGEIVHYMDNWFSSYITDDGKLYFLTKTKYPSDGITPSTIYINYYDLEVKYSRITTGTDVIVNRAVNLVPSYSQWTIHTNAFITNSYTIEHVKTGTDPEYSSIRIPVLPSTTYSFSGGGYGFYADEQTATGAYVKTAFNSSTKNITFKTSPTTYILMLLAYLPAGTTGTYTFSSPMLTRTDTSLNFASQEKYVVSLSQSQSISNGKKLSLQAENDIFTTNGMNLISYAGTEYLSKGFMIEPGTNHLQFNHSGSLMKVTVKYKERFNTP